MAEEQAKGYDDMERPPLVLLPPRLDSNYKDLAHAATNAMAQVAHRVNAIDSDVNELKVAFLVEARDRKELSGRLGRIVDRLDGGEIEFRAKMASANEFQDHLDEIKTSPGQEPLTAKDLDVHEGKKAQQALADIRARRSRIFEGVTIGVVTLALGGAMGYILHDYILHDYQQQSHQAK